VEASLDRSAWLSLLATASPAVAKRTNSAVMKCVKLVVEDDCVTIFATDTELSIRVKGHPVGPSRPGECLLNFDKFKEILSSLPEELVKISVVGESIKLVCGKTKYSLPTLKVEEYPDVQFAIPDDSSIALPAGELTKFIRRAAFGAGESVSSDGRPARYVTTHLCLELTKAALFAAGTDTKILSVAEFPLAHKEPPAKILLPLRSAQAIVKALSDPTEGLKLAFGKHSLLISTERLSIHTLLVAGRFPPYFDILKASEKSATVKATANPSTLLAAFRQASSVADVDACRVAATWASTLVLSVRDSQVGEADVEASLDSYDGQPVEMLIDPTYPVKFLSVLASEKALRPVTIHLVSEQKPMVFDAGDNWKVLIMPIYFGEEA